MQAKSKFNVGDTVYRIISGAVNVPVPGLVCPACQGKGYVHFNRSKAICKSAFNIDNSYPSLRYICDHGQLFETKWLWKADENPFTIDTVLAYDDTSDGSGLDISYEVSAVPDDEFELYEDCLFSTLEEAKAGAERKNNRHKPKQEVA